MSEQPEAGQTGGRSAPWSLVAALAVLLVLAVAVAGWLAIDGDDEPGADGTTAPSSATDASTFEQDGVPFTFDYPSSFATSEPPEGVLWVAGISPLDVIDVRRVSDREFSAQGMTEVYGTTLGEQEGLEVVGTETRTTGVGEVVVFDVTSATGTSSQLVYLAQAGSTWQLGCQSQADNAAAINDACALMLDTLAAA